MCSPNAKRKKALLKRDGNRCFYTGEVMKENEMSVEHLIPTYWGGTNNLQNLVLCKISENQKMGNKSLVEKLKYREKHLFDAYLSDLA